MLTVQLLCLASLGYADEACLDDTTSLFQEPVAQASKSKEPLAGLLASAKGMLIHGTTTDGSDWDGLLGALHDEWETVQTAILDQAQADQDFLSSSLAKFDDIIQTLNNFDFSGEQAQVNTAIEDHNTCRTTTEKDACTDKQHCEGDLYADMITFIDKETQFLSTSQALDAILCVENVSDAGVQANLVDAGTPFAAQAQAAKNAKLTYDAQKLECDTAHKTLDDASKACNELQTSMESASCAFVQNTAVAVAEFHESWKNQHASYQGITEMISRQEWDRRREYGRLVAVKCILNRLQELNGRPCDSSDLTAEDPELTVCEAEAANSEENLCTDDSTKVLCFDLQAPPADPDTPNVAEYPCTDDWNTNYMTPPAGVVPQPPFSHENIGCNAWPACVPCDHVIAEPVTDYHRWVKPVESDKANHADALAHATDQGYINEVGSVNYDDDGNPIETETGWSADAANADYEGNLDQGE